MPYNETKKKEELVDKWITVYSQHNANTRFGTKVVYTATLADAANEPQNYFDFFGSTVLDAELATEILPVTIRLRKAIGKNGKKYYLFDKKTVYTQAAL